MSKLRLAVFISGTGRTLENLIKEEFDVRLVVSNKKNARGLKIANHNHIPVYVDDVIDQGVFGCCRLSGIELICLAGFLQKLTIPEEYPIPIINIHPSLLPLYGGKGMYGMKVHESVLRNKEVVSGCTVHYVDNEYDHGEIIMQRLVPVLEGDSPHTLANRVFAEECIMYPEVIRSLTKSLRK